MLAIAPPIGVGEPGKAGKSGTQPTLLDAERWHESSRVFAVMSVQANGDRFSLQSRTRVLCFFREFVSRHFEADLSVDVVCFQNDVHHYYYH